jgi:fructosamine-3-kinase
VSTSPRDADDASADGAATHTAAEAHHKERHDAPEGFFEVEAAGLRWLGAATGGVQVVRVLSVGPRHIDLERLRPVAPTPAQADDLGSRLAVTHAAGAPAFGSPPDGWSGPAFIGRQSQRNDPTATWGVFYAEQRVRPFVRRAVQRGHLDAASAAVVERVCDRLAAGELDDGRPPARLHGDLWAGNVVYTDTGPVLIDPAAHGGHGLTDLAMLELFGLPGLSRVRSAYAEASPDFPTDWGRLVHLHQLHPLAVHAASHGPSYGVALLEAARHFA